MRCSHCQRLMLALFYTTVCQVCDHPPSGDFYAGFVVWELEHVPTANAPPLAYVWRTAHEAVVWRSLRGDDGLTIRTVLSEHPIQWHPAGGKAAGLVCGDRLFQIYPDHRFPPEPYRAFLVHPGFDVRSERVKLAA